MDGKKNIETAMLFWKCHRNGPKKDKPTDTSLADFDHLNQQTPDVTLIEMRHT